MQKARAEDIHSPLPSADFGVQIMAANSSKGEADRKLVFEKQDSAVATAAKKPVMLRNVPMRKYDRHSRAFLSI